MLQQWAPEHKSVFAFGSFIVGNVHSDIFIFVSDSLFSAIVDKHVDDRNIENPVLIKYNLPFLVPYEIVL